VEQAEMPSMENLSICELDTHDSGVFLFMRQIPLKAPPLLALRQFLNPLFIP
jgi:hypothetical protein